MGQDKIAGIDKALKRMADAPRAVVLTVADGALLMARIASLTEQLAQRDAEIQTAQAWILPITPCEKCVGSGYTDKSNGLICCPWGHAKECQCRVCQWARVSYAKDAELLKAQAEIERLREDAARLDWIERQCVFQQTIPQFWRNRNGRISFAPYDEAKLVEGDTLREAIDAAIDAALPAPAATKPIPLREDCDVDEYKAAVIALFKSGGATPEQWDEMAQIILGQSERSGTEHIDETLFGTAPAATEEGERS